MANQISVNTGSGAGAQQVIVDSNGNITVTVSRSVIGTVANVASANYANFAGNAFNVSLANVSGAGNIASINLDGNVSNVLRGNGSFGPETGSGNANYANFAGTAFSVAGANVSGTVANATFATTAGSANTANSATVANSANAVAGANVSGTVANATFATTAGSANTANSATVANSANSVTLANVSGAGNIASINLDGSGSNVLYGNGIFAPVAGGNTANANYANFAGNAFSVDGSNVVGAVANATFALDAGNANIANIAYSVDGANVSGTVANATFALDAGNANIANIAYSVDGANVSGAVANATFALDAGNANIANIAYSVDAANVSGLGNIATINLDGNASNLLDGTGNFVAIPTNVANANYANFAGTVLTNAQPNITSTGNLVSLTINNAVGNTVTNQFNPNLITVPTTFQFPNAVSVIKTSGVTGALNTVQPFYIIKDRPGNAAANNNDFIVRNVYGATNSGGNVNVSNDFFNQVRGTPGVGNAWVPGSYSWRNALTYGNLTPNNSFTTGFISMNQVGTFGVSAGAPGSSGITLATFGTQFGTISNTAPASAFVVSRGRGNGDSRLTVEPNDYIGDFTWVGTVANGSSGGQTAKLRAKIDSTYVANTTNMPIGFELQTVGNAGALNTHNFYANGNVEFSNQVSAIGNIVAGNGNVTLNSTGTIAYLRTFGSFTSNATQTSNGANTTNYMTLNNTEDANGISIASSTQITVARTGRYNIQFSAQVEKTDGGTDLVEIWLDKNGSAVANSATQITLQGSGAKAVAAWDFNVDAANVNDYFQLAWASPDTAVQLTAIDTANTISGVAVPSLIVNVNPVGA